MQSCIKYSLGLHLKKLNELIQSFLNCAIQLEAVLLGSLDLGIHHWIARHSDLWPGPLQENLIWYCCSLSCIFKLFPQKESRVLSINTKLDQVPSLHKSSNHFPLNLEFVQPGSCLHHQFYLLSPSHADSQQGGRNFSLTTT